MSLTLSYIAARRNFDFRSVLLLFRHVECNGRGDSEIVVCLHSILFHKRTGWWDEWLQPSFGWDWCTADKRYRKRALDIVVVDLNDFH